MAITLTGGPTDAVNAGSADHVTSNFPCVAGRYLVVVLEFYGHATATVSSITCAGESNLTLIGSIQRNAALGNVAMQIGYLSNISSTATKAVQDNISASIA